MKKSTTGLLLGSALVIGLSGCASDFQRGGERAGGTATASTSTDRAWYQQPVVCGIAGGLIGAGIGYGVSSDSDEDAGAAIGATSGAAIGGLLCADRTPEPAPVAEPEPMPEPEPVTEFETVTLDSEVTFAFDSEEIRPGAHRTLEEVATTLRDNTNLRVRIEGHTDSVGSAQYNEGLSQRRADSVRSFLASRGISEQRMTTRGFGEQRPVATNDTDAGRAQNRRVEVVNWD